MASSSSDKELPFPLSSCKAASKPEGRKRYRETYSSSTSSGSSPRKARSFYHEADNKKMKQFGPTDILCLYPKDCYLGTYPSFIKFVRQHPSPGAVIVQTDTGNLQILLDNTKDDLKEFDLPTLNETEKKTREFVFSCVEILLADLEADEFFKWTDTSTLTVRERLKKCKEMAQKYGIHLALAEIIIVGIRLLLDAFLNGFSNGLGRSAIENIFKICSLILETTDTSEADYVMNLGGGSPLFAGNTTTLQTYATSSGKLTMKEATKQLSLEMAEVKVWVPDAVVFNYNESAKIPEKEYYMFAECKSGPAAKKSLYYQLWHESLRGLINFDVVYSLGMCTSFMTLCKLVLKGNILVTHVISMGFGIRKDESELTVKKIFNIVEFKLFIQHITKAIQDPKTL